MGLEILDTLFPATYNLVPFHVLDATVIGGRKTIVHKFPNSDNQIVEDLGKQTREHRIRAIIAGPNFRIKRTALLFMLERGGIGLLVHPYFGPIVQKISVKSFVLNESMEHLGYGAIDIVFELSQGNGLLAILSTAVDVVSGAAKTVSGVVSDISG